jgi:hypothetical protein
LFGGYLFQSVLFCESGGFLCGQGCFSGCILSGFLCLSYM